jgi:hypothetical protein
MSAESATHLSPTLTSLPPELHLKIFSYLDTTTSICLGLTNKNFYLIHKSLHPSPFIHRIPLSWYFSPFPGIDILLKEWYGTAGYKFHITYDSKVRGPWTDTTGEFMTNEEWKFFRRLKDFLDRGFERYGVGKRERWFMVYRGVPSHKVWTDWPTRPLNPSSQGKEQGRVMWDPGRVTVKKFHPASGLMKTLWMMVESTRKVSPQLRKVEYEIYASFKAVNLFFANS